MVANNSVVVKIKEKDFRKSLKKIMKELDKFEMDDQAKIAKMINAYVSLF